MDQFEAAKLKHAKNYERQHRVKIEPEPLPVVVPDSLPVLLQAPKEKPKHAAVIHVMVVLPDREFTFSLTKPHIYQNITANRLNKSEVKKCLEDGLRPLLGSLDDFPRGC